MSKRSPEKPEGFPLNSREREALRHIAQGSIARPKGAGSQTITTLVSRKWIRRIGDDQYVLTDLGQVRDNSMMRRLTPGLVVHGMTKERQGHRRIKT
jgi:hypothetical protein